MAPPASRSRFLKFRKVSEGRLRADIKPKYCEWPIPVCKAPRPVLEVISSRWPPFASLVALGRADTVDGVTITAFYF